MRFPQRLINLDDTASTACATSGPRGPQTRLLANSLSRFVGNPAYNLAELQADLARYFPGGKSELAAEVLAYVDSQVGPVIEGICETQAPIPAMHAILTGAALVMTGGSQPAGCTVAAITLAEGVDGEALRSTAREIFSRWQRSFRRCLLRTGMPEQRAVELATLLIAGLEGALVLCRAEGSTEPLDRVAAAMEYALRT